jgi:transposase
VFANVKYNDGMRRHELTDQQWERLAPLLPAQKPRVGKPNHDHRRLVNGLLWRLRTGVPWRDLPERYGKWQTVYSRFRRWQAAGIWQQVFGAVQAAADARGQLDWTLHFVDGSVVRAHQHAAGARKKGAPKRSAAVAAGSARRSMSARSAAASPSASS